MNVAPIIQRLRDAVPVLKLVGGAAQYERALAGLTTLPAAFVLPASETAAENPFMDQLVQQEVAAQFTVLLAARNLADDEGAAALESLEPVRIAVREALLGFTPTGALHPCEFVSGDLIAFANGVLWWADSFRSAYLIRSQ